MAFYTVMTPPPVEGGGRGAIEKAKLIADSFSWGAFLLTGLWLLSRRLWLATLLFLLFWGVVWLLHAWIGLNESALSLLYWVFAFVLGLEGRNLVVRKLTRQGWQLADVVEARTLAEAERRWFERALAGDNAAPLAVPSTPAAPPRPTGPLPIIGLFPEARGR